MTTIDREFLRMLADEYAGPGNPSIPADTLRSLLDALEQAEAELGRLKYHYLYNPGNQCPTCAGPIHRDMAGIYWTTRSAGQEQAEAERDAYRAKMDELDRAYLSEHGQRKRAEARIKAVYELLDENPAAYATVYSNNVRRALDG